MLKIISKLPFIFTLLVMFSCEGNKIGTSSLVSLDDQTQENDVTNPVDNGFGDSFSDPATFADWDCVDRDGWDQDGSGSTSDDCNSAFDIGGGQLTITARGADVWGNTHQFNGFYKRDLSGDFDFSVQVVSFNTSPNAWSKFGFFMANDANDIHQGGYFMCAQTISNRVTQQWSSAGNGNINTSGSDSNNSTPKYLRLQKQGNNISCYFRDNSTAPWTLHNRGTTNIPSIGVSFDVGLIATSHNTSAELVVVMDDFQDLSP
jgi:hypothetical protein